MPKHSLKPPTQKAQREKHLDAHTQLWLLSLDKVAFLDPAFVCDGSDLIPGTVMEYFSVLLVLSRIGLAAQNAQRVHGVPASLLIGKYLVDYGWCPEGSREEAEQLFLEEAETLSRNFPTPPVLHLVRSPVEYAIALDKLGGLMDSSTGDAGRVYLLDVIDRILDHGLLECDYRYGTGGLYDIGDNLCPEDVATVLSCSLESVFRLFESGELHAYRSCRCSEKCRSDWRVSGRLLRTYVQWVQRKKLLGTHANGSPVDQQRQDTRLFVVAHLDNSGQS